MFPIGVKVREVHCKLEDVCTFQIRSHPALNKSQIALVMVSGVLDKFRLLESDVPVACVHVFVLASSVGMRQRAGSHELSHIRKSCLCCRK